MEKIGEDKSSGSEQAPKRAPLEVAEEELLEATLDVEISPMMEPLPALISQAPASATPPSRYWQAQGFADTLQREFDEAQKRGDLTTIRERFYALATYYTRTAAILRYALNKSREPLAQAALHNLFTLHKSLHHMHRAAPGSVPSTLTLNRDVRSRLIEDLVGRILQDASEPLDLPTITRRFNAVDLLADVSEQVIRRHAGNLISSGHIQLVGEKYVRTSRAYSTVNLDQAGLQTLLGPLLFRQLDQAGFHGLSDVTAARKEFRSALAALTSFSDGTAALFAAVAEALAASAMSEPTLSPWRHTDLIGSSHLRPYQYEAHAIFRGYGYRGQVIEAPTGSGKTMIGMMCIQDWLRTLTEGQSILVLVPTVNYQQQWVGELCYKPLGLHLSSHQVFTGTPASLEAVRKRTGVSPAVTVMTYTALAQTGSGMGKGGFDQDSIEIFLQGNNIQYVILDEVHKVAEDMHSVSADVTRILTDWVRDGSLKGLIGFSGTAAAYRPRFAQLGLQLVYIMPAAELIAYGFVAPFAEFGVPFAYSDREQRIRDLLDAYKARLRNFVALIGGPQLRRWFAAIPLEERVDLGHTLLRMYAGQKDRKDALLKRLQAWETGGELGLAELSLITLVQLSKGWSDEALVRAACAETEQEDDRLTRFYELRLQIEAIRNELKPLIYRDDTVRRLGAEGFGTTFDAHGLRQLLTEVASRAVRAERVKDGLATTIVGLYDGLSDWYLRVGEGRVDSIKAIIEAERRVRPVQGVIIFDAGTRIRWQAGKGEAQTPQLAAPGYSGVGGVFSQMLGDKRFTPMAALSSEIYLPYDAADPLPARIAAFIKREIMLGELGEALFGLTTQGLDLQDEQLMALRHSFNAILADYVHSLTAVGTARPGEFYRKVLAPFRKAVRKAKLGALRDRLLARLSLKHYHVRNCVLTFFDYALIVDAFLNAHVAELEQVSGSRQKFFVVKMAPGDRKQLMYDLTARIVDAEDLPINMIIVSPWARTGWNVIKPNVLIDATATRNVTAWQQLRGRAMRAMRTWTNECYRLVLLLMSSRPHDLAASVAMPEDVLTALEELQDEMPAPTVLDAASRALLRDAHLRAGAGTGEDDIPPSSYEADEQTLAAKIERGVIADFTAQQRAQLVTELMLTRNKVTHIYELVKAYGSTTQIQYDRPTHQWLRTASIARKHDLEYAVSPLSGQFAAGFEHAPLMYSGDPRKDVPSELELHLALALQNCDPQIVKGWLKAIVVDTPEEEVWE
ncbi:MAG: hypothetical protein NVSMB27_12540 [Ktedonobacteraceae bacterium]